MVTVQVDRVAVIAPPGRACYARGAGCPRRARRPGGHHADVVPVVVGDVGRVGPAEAPELHRHVVAGVGELDADVVRQRRERRPTRAARRTSRRGPPRPPLEASAASSSPIFSTALQLGAEPLDQRLVRLASQDEADRLLLSTGPGRVGRYRRRAGRRPGPDEASSTAVTSVGVRPGPTPAPSASRLGGCRAGSATAPGRSAAAPRRGGSRGRPTVQVGHVGTRDAGPRRPVRRESGRLGLDGATRY